MKITLEIPEEEIKELRRRLKMSKLKCSVETTRITKTMIHVEQHHLEEFIKEVYGKPFNIMEDIGSRNTNKLEFSLQDDTPPYNYMGRLDRWKDGKSVTHITYILLKDMLSRNLILPGIYLIWLNKEGRRCQS